tara:strand:+ start:1940 stop:2470 length:531 start_codon:yes stop_codon:yes gene_type:complete
MINIDLILIFLTLLIFFYTVEMVCNYVVITNNDEEDEEDEVEGFDIDDITDSPLSIICLFLSSAVIGYLIYKYFKGKKKSEIQQSIDLEKIKTDASVAEAKVASDRAIELEKIKIKEKKEAEDKAAAQKKAEAEAAGAEAAGAEAAGAEAAAPTNNQAGGEVGALNAISRFVQMLI